MFIKLSEYCRYKFSSFETYEIGEEEGITLGLYICIQKTAGYEYLVHVLKLLPIRNDELISEVPGYIDSDIYQVDKEGLKVLLNQLYSEYEKELQPYAFRFAEEEFSFLESLKEFINNVFTREHIS